MDDSLKGYIITFSLISIFLLAFINFIIMFPEEQGFSLSERDNNTWASLNQINASTTISSNLGDFENKTNTGWKEWDTEAGFMGSNTQKASKTSAKNYMLNVLTIVKAMAKQVFTTDNGSVHPVMVIIGLITTLIGVVATLVFIKFVRSGT